MAARDDIRLFGEWIHRQQGGFKAVAASVSDSELKRILEVRIKNNKQAIANDARALKRLV